MKKLNFKSAVLLLALFFVFSFRTSAKVNVPRQTAWVMDTAGVIDSTTKDELESYLRNVDEQSGVQIAVLTVNSLEESAGEETTLEEYAAEVFESWGLGQKDKDNGVLLLICMDSKTLRIETGYGLEGVLTDTKCGLIIRNFIVPEFKNGDYSAGIKKGVETIAGYAVGDTEITEKVDSSADRSDDSASIGAVLTVIWIAFFIFMVFMGLTNKRPPRGGMFIGGGFDHDSHGGSGGGFGGGSSFGGGGGGHSGGGGASGGW